MGDLKKEKKLSMPAFQKQPSNRRMIILLCILAVVCLGFWVYVGGGEDRTQQERIAFPKEQRELQAQRLTPQTKDMEEKIVNALNKYQIQFGTRKGTIEFHMEALNERMCKSLVKIETNLDIGGCHYKISDWTVSCIKNSSAYVARKVQKSRNVLNGEEGITTLVYVINPETHTITATDWNSCAWLNPMKSEMLIREQADAERYVRECSRNDFYVE